MHLSLLLFACLTVAVLSCIMHTTKDSDVPKERLQGFKHLDALAFVTKMKAAGVTSDKKPASNKYVLMCSYAYCHGIAAHKCNEYCRSTPFDREIINAKAKTLNGSKKPVANIFACKKECEAECGKADCEKECDLLCTTHFSKQHRKEYEAEFNELIGRFNKK